jgi:uncharacterized protein YjiS (DUF1127 family)
MSPKPVVVNVVRLQDRVNFGNAARRGSKVGKSGRDQVPHQGGKPSQRLLQSSGTGDVVRNLRMRLRERRMPLELDDHVLRDVGLTRVEYRFLLMSRATTDPDRSQNSRNLHDRPPSSLYVTSVAESRKPEIVA